jgi:hypothetical protein
VTTAKVSGEELQRAVERGDARKAAHSTSAGPVAVAGRASTDKDVNLGANFAGMMIVLKSGTFFSHIGFDEPSSGKARPLYLAGNSGVPVAASGHPTACPETTVSDRPSSGSPAHLEPGSASHQERPPSDFSRGRHGRSGIQPRRLKRRC